MKKNEPEKPESNKFRPISALFIYLFADLRLSFFLYVFWLHEESIKLYVKMLKGFKPDGIPDGDFPMYRRILKLVLEQGCDIDLTSGDMPTGGEVLEMDQRVRELMYVGYYLYYFADLIAYQKMIEEANEIDFKDGLMGVGWQHHYGKAADELFPALKGDYENGTFDLNAIKELASAIEGSFGINPHFAAARIWELKERESRSSTNLQTIEPNVLIQYLAATAKVYPGVAATFCEGLTISRENRLSVSESIRKPHSMLRHFFRPILLYVIDGRRRALIGREKFTESLVIFSTNAIHWGNLYSEWEAMPGMVEFKNNKSLMHDRILEDEIQKIANRLHFPHCRNIKSFKRQKGNNINIVDKGGPGEIDFIIANEESKILFVCDTKYNRARYEAVGYRIDYSNFTGHHEVQLKRKLDWVAANIPIVQEHLSVIYHRQVNLTGFQLQPAFLINTPSFYMFNGTYRAVTLNQLEAYLKSGKQFSSLTVFDRTAGKNIIKEHPFFTKNQQ